MRPVLFATCFSLGVFLMMFSSVYQPRPAQASSADDAQTEGKLDDTGRVYRPRPKLPTGLIREGAVEVEETLTTDAALPDRALDDFPLPTPEPREMLEHDPADDDIWTEIKPATDDSTEVSDPNLVSDWEEVVADAGADLLVWAGVPRIDLDGELSIGDGLQYEWRQLSGPTLEIAEPGAAVTSATGLPFGGYGAWQTEVYIFELTVTDPTGRQSSDTVTIYAQPAPDLTLVPGDTGKAFTDKYFGEMQGVPLAHFEGRISGPEGRMATFVIDADSPLIFDALESGDFEMWYSDENGRHLYQFDVYQTGDEAQTWLVFFVETEEQIPAVVRLGVAWYDD